MATRYKIITTAKIATGATADTGTDNEQYLTSKTAKDSHNIPSVVPSTSGNVLTSNGTDWTSAAPAAGGGAITTADQITSTVATGTAPFVVASTTLNSYLNADRLDGQHGSYFAPKTAISGTVNYIPKFSTTTDLGNNSQIFDNGTSVGINNASPNANALLDLTSTSKAFMPPRMTTTQKAAISSPTAGMVVYDSTLGKLCVYGNGATWETITSV